MRERCRIATVNYAAGAGATLTAADPSAWEALGDLVRPGLVSAPARCLAGHDPGRTRIVLDMGKRRTVAAVALFWHTLGARGLWRPTLANDAAVTDGVWSPGWLRAVPRVYPSMARPWTDENWWLGTPTRAELEAYGAPIIYPLPAPRSGRYLALDFDDTRNPVGYFDLGFLYVCNWTAPEVNFSRGARQSVEMRDLVDETPSGFEVIETRRPRRRHEIPFDATTKEAWARLYDAAVVNRSAAPVLFVPTLADPRNLFREAFLGRLSDGSAGREVIGAAGLSSTSLSIREVIE